MATIDIPLEPLKQLISSLQGDQGERFLLLSARQRILYSDNAEYIGQPVLDVYRNLGRPDIAAALQQAAASRDTRMLQLAGWDSTNTQWISPAMIESGGWMLLSIQDEQRALAFLDRQKARAITSGKCLRSECPGSLAAAGLGYPTAAQSFAGRRRNRQR